jgi:PTH1 family peptidyl-tRNA hydrolase
MTNAIQLLVGLGNIGSKYELNRHNVGFLFVDFLKQKYAPDTKWQTETKFKSLVCEISIDGHKLLLAKPTTLMNLSGEAVSLLRNYYKLSPDQIAVAHDDMDIALGKAKFQMEKGPKVHNGLASINQMLSTEDYYRIRIGIENRAVRGNKGIPGVAYALQNFSPEELTIIKSVFATLSQ